ncbi:HEPN domain-containing protein [Plesiomonas shigelloides]|uniref:HEPN domain-containing protein n=1 Tax=Plesiomonas shigelloides TaxID=703 RepID=UPI00387F11E4
MSHSDILLNDFAIRSFRDTADCDYIAARLSFRAQLVPQFLWQSLQAIEKYIKCILVLNRVKSPKSHNLSKLLSEFEKTGKFDIHLSEETRTFIQYLDKYARFRYYEVPFYSLGNEIFQLDAAVWELRRYARVLDYNIKLPSNKEVNLLSAELKRNKQAETRSPQEFSIIGGHLEHVIEKTDHPSREGLIWINRHYGTQSKEPVSFTQYTTSGNSPLSLHPEILDEVIKYVYLPKDVINAYKELAQQDSHEIV